LKTHDTATTATKWTGRTRLHVVVVTGKRSATATATHVAGIQGKKFTTDVRMESTSTTGVFSIIIPRAD